MLLAILFSVIVKPTIAQEISVWTKDPKTAHEVYKGSNVHYADDDQKQVHEHSGYMAPKQRDALFHRAGFDAIVAKMDDVDKDILIMTAHSHDVAGLKKYYPKIKTEDLAKLKAALEQTVADK